MTSRWCEQRRRWLRRVGVAAWGTGLCLGAVSGCSPSESWRHEWWPGGQSSTWYGYYYENVMVNGAPAMSRPFASAKQCLAAMHAYTHNSSRWTGFACARGCLPQKNGALTDCIEVVH